MSIYMLSIKWLEFLCDTFTAIIHLPCDSLNPWFSFTVALETLKNENNAIYRCSKRSTTLLDFLTDLAKSQEMATAKAWFSPSLSTDEFIAELATLLSQINLAKSLS